MGKIDAGFAKNVLVISRDLRRFIARTELVSTSGSHIYKQILLCGIDAERLPRMKSLPLLDPI
jgi:hypothetical protein